MKSKDLRKYKDEFIKLYNEGFSIRKISQMYNVDKTSVTRYILEEVSLRQKGLTEHQKINAKKLYLEGLNVNSIAKSINANYSTTKRYLSKEFGVVTDGVKKYEHLFEDIIKDYASGLNATEISEKYNISRQTAMDYVGESNVKARNYSEASRIYDLNENYFDTLDSNKSYILGLVFAKGRTNERYGCKFVDIVVYKDRFDILDKITKEIYISGNSPVLNNTNNNLCLRISSNKLSETLYNLGLYKSKEDKINPLSENIDKKEFWKGFIYAGMRINSKNIYVSGNENHIFLLSEYLDKIGIKYRKSYDTGITIARNTEINKLVNDFGYDFLKTFIKEYVSNLDEGKKHNWSSVINN